MQHVEPSITITKSTANECGARWHGQATLPLEAASAPPQPPADTRILSRPARAVYVSSTCCPLLKANQRLFGCCWMIGCSCVETCYKPNMPNINVIMTDAENSLSPGCNNGPTSCTVPCGFHLAALALCPAVSFCTLLLLPLHQSSIMHGSLPRP